ncbi:MAG: DUF1080 domain-containing protein [Thermoflexibacter sp.]|nr:DUF1080 domain-containing protein [Thermoflexibacter sp.]
MRKCILILYFLLGSLAIYAQNNIYSLTQLPLDNLSAFNAPPNNWQIVGKVKGSFNDPNLQTVAGTGILANLFSKDIQYKPEANIFTNFSHGDMYLELDFMLPQGSNSGIYFQSRYEIQLFDSWNTKKLEIKDCGSIYERWDDKRPEGKKGFDGRTARVNASFAPAIWQHLEILFQAPKFDANGNKITNAKFTKVVLNGVTIHENVVLSGATRAAVANDEKSLAPLMIQGDHGQVFFKNIKYALLGDLNVKIKDLEYEYYETKERDFNKITEKQLIRKGKVEAFDYRLADLQDKLSLKFTCKIEVPTTDNYTFTLMLTGNCNFKIDNKELIPFDKSWTWFYGAPLIVHIPLSAGTHDLSMQFSKQDGWAPIGLAIFVQKPNSKPFALHTIGSFLEKPQSGLIESKIQGEPEILRSFLQFDNQKKTHCVSVGDPKEIHYSYDLKQASLLQVWKGKFLNMNEMWFERGEPQIAQPLGATIQIFGKTPLIFVNNLSDDLPDSLDAKALIYKGYILNEKHYPTFRYELENISFTDDLFPNQDGKGLARVLKISSLPSAKKVIFRLAEGGAIQEISKNLYAINDQQYFLQVHENQDFNLLIKQQNGKQFLIAEGQGTEIKYAIIW